MHVRTRAQRVLRARSFGPRADPRGARHRHRRRSRDATRDAARLRDSEAEESFGGVGHARVDPDALAAKLARWEHDQGVEREFRLERRRGDAKAEETNGGFRPTLSSTPRAVALRDRVASADRRPWRARLGDASTRRTERADAKIPSRRRTIRTEGRTRRSAATPNDSNGGGTRSGGSRDARGRLRRATRVGTPIVATRHARQRDARRNSRRRTRRDWRASRVATIRASAPSRGSRRFVSREGTRRDPRSRRGVRRRAAVDARRDSRRGARGVSTVRVSRRGRG